MLIFDTLGKYVESVQPLPSIGGCFANASSSLGSVPVPDIVSFALPQTAGASFTLNGRFKSFPPTMLVHAIDATRINLDTVDNAKLTATAMGFSNPIASANNTQFQWKTASNTKQLNFNATTGVWKLTTQYFFDPDALKAKTLNQNQSFYPSQAARILKSLNFTNATLTNTVATSIYATIGSDGNFTSPSNPASASYVVLDIFRNLTSTVKRNATTLSEAQVKACDKAENFIGKVFKQDPRRGSLRLIVSDQLQDLKKDLYGLDFTDYRYSGTTGNYNIVTVEQAFTKLQTGEGKLVQIQLSGDETLGSNRQLNVKRFVINADQTELAYFESDKYQPFVFPIFVFKGVLETADGQTGRFIFYIDAVQRFAAGASTSQAK